MSLENLYTFTEDGQDCSIIDIVAIHGLAEGANETWTHRSNGINWLKDLLPYAAKGALRPRVFSYSYSPDVAILLGSDASNTILRHAQTLVSVLQAERSLSGTSQRPLIFICHGSGGILVKRALAFSAAQVSQKVTHNYSVYISTYGIIFLGTPHNGLESHALQAIARAQKHPGDSSTLAKAQHEILQELSDVFAPLVKQFHIFLLWERFRTRIGHQCGYVVGEASAAPMWDDTERSGINANHSHMCKFENANSSDFRVILDALLRYSRTAGSSILNRWHNAHKYLATQRSIEASELVGFNVHAENQPFVYLNSSILRQGETQRVQNKYFHVPHNASNIFTGQKHLSLEVRQRMLRAQQDGAMPGRKVFVMYGLGGSGKSQFCLKFVEEYRDSFWAIFWVDASSIETAERAFTHIGKTGGVGENHQAGIYWLTSLDQPWMLVIDNADDPLIDYSRFLPGGKKAHILMTSRLQDCRIHATVGYHEFRSMDEEDAITLLLRAAYEEDTEDARMTARPIVRALGSLPLALTQAGASIRQRICSLGNYLRLYESHATELMEHRCVQDSDSNELSIFTTWDVTVRRIEKQSSRAAKDAIQILQTLAFMHFDQVPVSIFERAWINITKGAAILPPRSLALKLCEQCSYLPVFTSTISKLLPSWIACRQERLPEVLVRAGTSWNSVRFRAALAILENHSLIYRSTRNEETYSMHPMVHSWARERLRPHDRLAWSDITTNTIAASIATQPDPKQQPYRTSLIPHITACLRRDYAKTLLKGMESDYQISICNKFARVYSEGGGWKEASALQERILQIYEADNSSNEFRAFEVMIALADTYWNLDQIGKSLQLLHKAVQVVTTTLGPYDPRTLRATDKLAGTLWLCGRRAEAKILSEVTVERLGKVLSPDHPYTLDAMDTLGRTLMHLSQAGEAAGLHEKVLDKRMDRLGPSHPDTLMAMANLGMSYHGLKDFAQAEELLNTVFHERSRVLGAEHAYTLWAINDLAKIRCDRGYPIEAEGMLTEMLPIVTRTLGDDHVGMSMTKYNLATTYYAQERWAEGRNLLLEIIEIQKKKMPPQHPDRIASALELARGTRYLGHAEEAKAMLKEIIDLSIAVHGPEDTRTLKAMGRLSSIYIAQGDLEEAEKMDAMLRKAPSLVR